MKLTKTLRNKDNQMKTIRIICSKIYIGINMPMLITIKHCSLSNLWSGCNLSEWTFTSCCLQLAFVTRAYQEKSSSSYSFCCCGDDMLLPYNFPLPYSFDLDSLLSPAGHVGAQVILLVLVQCPPPPHVAVRVLVQIPLPVVVIYVIFHLPVQLLLHPRSG